MAPYRTGLLIIRAWIEEGSASPLRAEIRSTSDVSKSFENDQMVADADKVVAIVQAWLAKYVDSNAPAVVKADEVEKT